MIVFEKLTEREIYSVLLLSSGSTPTSQKYFRKVFTNEHFDWKKIYILPRVVAINSFKRNFQYKILHKILYLKKMLFTFGKTKIPVFILSFIRWDYQVHIFRTHMCKASVESFKIVSNQWYLSSNTNATNRHFWFY